MMIYLSVSFDKVNESCREPTLRTTLIFTIYDIFLVF